MNIIQIEGMEFYAYHGCFAEEQIIGNKFLANLTIETDFLQAAQNDDLTGTIDYVSVYEIIKEEMNIKSKLLEHVAYRIIKRIKNTFPFVFSVEIKLAKLNPPLRGKIEQVSVTIKK